jgi:hypothetical protein
MASFQEFEKGMKMVYDYGVFVDIERHETHYTYTFNAFYNQTEYYVKKDEKHEEQSELICTAVSNVLDGKRTYAKLAITEDDSWIMEVYTEEEFEKLVSEDIKEYLSCMFYQYLNANIERKKHQEKLLNLLAEISEKKEVVVEEKIGFWTRKVTLYGYDCDKYLRILTEDVEKHKVWFPLLPFMKQK